MISNEILINVNLANCNKINDKTYRYILPQTLYLDRNCGYQARLVNIALSPNYVNIRGCSIDFVHLPSGVKLRKSLPQFVCTRPASLTAVCNQIFNSNDVRELFGTGAVEPVSMRVPDNNNYIILEQTGQFDQNQYRIEFSKNLAIKLGFSRNIIPSLPYAASKTPNIDYECEYVFVLTNIIENSFFDDEMLPVLHNFAVHQDTRTSTVTEYAYAYSPRKQNYTSLVSRGLTVSSVDSIEFQLLHETKIPLQFDSIVLPNIIITLMIQRKVIVLE
jgi:hypothetical protein